MTDFLTVIFATLHDRDSFPKVETSQPLATMAKCKSPFHETNMKIKCERVDLTLSTILGDNDSGSHMGVSKSRAGEHLQNVGDERIEDNFQIGWLNSLIEQEGEKRKDYTTR